MLQNRLELALERLGPGDWEAFEHFASQFLASEMPELRTVARSAGDRGRDADLFTPAGDPSQVLQYSVSEDWKQKLRGTASRIAETLPSAQLLIYATNQAIGAAADSLKIEIHARYHLHVDIRDRSYFVERSQRDALTESAAEALAEKIVDPYLSSRGVLATRTTSLDNDEARAAHVYLSLQLRDEARDKGLTKISFEALVRSVLLRTHADNRMPRAEIKESVRQLVPDNVTRVDQLTDAALAKLNKVAIRHYPQSDEFCLTHEERLRAEDYIAREELDEAQLLKEITTVINGYGPPTRQPADPTKAALRVRRVLDRYLYDRAETFASAVVGGKAIQFTPDRVQQVAREDTYANVGPKGDAETDPSWVSGVIHELLLHPGEAILTHLRELADAYTLMAFLRQTPDVQRAVRKMFAHGEVWLDTSMVLPLMAEELLEEVGQFQQIIKASQIAGLRFFVTSGVVEEIERHLSRALTCSRMVASWSGPYPFLMEAFLQSGGSPGAFPSWTETFMGPCRPHDDIEEFLEEKFGIQVVDLGAELGQVPDKLRYVIEEKWQRIHAARRDRHGSQIDPIALTRLAKHDTENFLGVVQHRKQQQRSIFGYSSWWLTLDRAAFSLLDGTRDELDGPPPDSPVLSIDFLAQYLTFGPNRWRLTGHEAMIPLAPECKIPGYLTQDLIAEAESVRREMAGLPERIVKRRVRDHLDEARRRIGPMAMRGLDVFFEQLKT